MLTRLFLLSAFTLCMLPLSGCSTDSHIERVERRHDRIDYRENRRVERRRVRSERMDARIDARMDAW